MKTLDEIQEHIRMNTTKKAGAYSEAVVIAALYKKLYGDFPKCGLSGAQAEIAQQVFEELPNRKV